MTTPPPPDVSRPALDRLLAQGCETSTLDYKQAIDLDSARDIIEIAKDVGAFQPAGGHLVIGADNSGRLVPGGGIASGQVAKFDEANLRGKLARYLGTDFHMHTAVHRLPGVNVGIIHLPPHPDGYLPFRADGNHADPKRPGQQTTVFRAGDIYIRRGTASVKANDTEMRSLIQAAAMRAAAPAVLTWRADPATTEAATADALAADDDVAIRRFLGEAVRDARRLLTEPAATLDRLCELLDAIACFAARALRWGRGKHLPPAVDALHKLYVLVTLPGGAPRPGLAVPATRVMLAIVNRVLALGAVSVEERAWTAIPQLVLKAPHPDSSHWTNWIRHGQVHATRERLLSHTYPAGHAVAIPFLEQALLDVQNVHCLNPDAPDADRLRDLIAQFDALATLAVYHHAPGDGDHPYYPWHRAYHPNRYEPALAEMLRDPELRAVVYPADDCGLAQLLLKLQVFAASEFAKYDGGWPYMDDSIRVFVAGNQP